MIGSIHKIALVTYRGSMYRDTCNAVASVEFNDLESFEKWITEHYVGWNLKDITVTTSVITTFENLGSCRQVFQFYTLEEFDNWIPKYLNQSEIENHPNYNMY